MLKLLQKDVRILFENRILAMVHVNAFILGYTNHKISLVVLNIDAYEIRRVLLTCDLSFYEIVTIDGIPLYHLVPCVQDLRTSDRGKLSNGIFSLLAEKYTLGLIK